MKQFSLLFLTLFSALFSENFVTYEFSGGRFGDCLLTYLHAKWLSYKYQMPLLYKPFDYSSELKLDQMERRFQRFGRLVALNAMNPVPVDSRDSRIFVCPYFPEDPTDLWLNPSRYRFDIDKKDKAFQKIAKEMIAPKSPLPLTLPPEHTVNIAIHLREGGGYDTDHTRLWDPLKLPPLSFYTDALTRALHLFQGKKIHCHLFTDALDPGQLIAELEKSVAPEAAVHFETRRENNHHAANVLEDFFSLFHYDVLIRPYSNFSVVASMIHDYCLVVSPKNFKREGTRITITEIVEELDEELYQKLLGRTQ